MNSDSLEDQVHDALHRRVDPLLHAPLSVGDVRRRARRIKRRRQGVAGVAVAAALAIAVPVGLAISGPAQRTGIEPATPTPDRPVIGKVSLDPANAPVGDPPAVPIINVDQPSLFTDGQVLALPKLYDSITPYLDGWVGIANNEGALSLEILTEDFEVKDGPVPTGGLVVSSDGQHLAWSEYDGTRWQVVSGDTAGGDAQTYTPFPRSTPDSVVRPIGFVSATQVVASQTDSAGAEVSFLLEAGERIRVGASLQAVSSSPASGAVAGFTRITDSGSCSGVVDAGVATGAVAWQTCDYALGSFSPDGRTIVGFAPERDGYGSTSVSLLDASSGEPLVDFELDTRGNQLAAISDRVAWEDNDTLAVTLVNGRQQYVVRVDLDGSVERVGGDFATVPIDTVGLLFAAAR